MGLSTDELKRDQAENTPERQELIRQYRNLGGSGGHWLTNQQMRSTIQEVRQAIDTHRAMRKAKVKRRRPKWRR